MKDARLRLARRTSLSADDEAALASRVFRRIEARPISKADAAAYLDDLGRTMLSAM